MNPKIIWLDEPTSALDPELIGQDLTVMKTLAEEPVTMPNVPGQLNPWARSQSSTGATARESVG